MTIEDRVKRLEQTQALQAEALEFLGHALNNLNISHQMTEAVIVALVRGGALDAGQLEAAFGEVIHAPPPEYRGQLEGARAELLLRLPSATLTETLEELRALGEVEELTLQTDDVTREVQDLDARITALRSSVERLLALQDAAATVEDLIDLETAISDRQGQLESLEAQQRYLADQVDLSTLRLTLGSDATAPVDDPDTFLTGLIAGWESLVAVGSGLLVIAGVLLPWLAVLGVLALATLLVVRGARRRRGHAADQAPAAGASTTSA